MKKFLFVAMLAGILMSCSNDDDVDNTMPEINVIKPADDTHFKQGDVIDFEAILTDNVAVQSYKIDIHYAGDGHVHEKSASEEDHVEWSMQKDYAIDTPAAQVTVSHSEIVVPENAEPGGYHFGVYCVDAAGNESSVFLDMEIEE